MVHPAELTTLCRDKVLSRVVLIPVGDARCQNVFHSTRVEGLNFLSSQFLGNEYIVGI